MEKDFRYKTSVLIQFSKTVLSDICQGTDPEDVIKNAFGCFDEDNVGLIHEDRLRELLTTIGDRFTDDEVGNLEMIMRVNSWVTSRGGCNHYITLATGK